MSSNRKYFASKLPPLVIKREPYIDSTVKYINISIDNEMSSFIHSIEESAQLPLTTIQNFIQSFNSTDKTSTIDTLILELYGLKFRIQSTGSSDHVVVYKIIDYLLPSASESLQDEIAREGVLFDGEDFNEIFLLYRIFPTNLLNSFSLKNYSPIKSALASDINLAEDHSSDNKQLQSSNVDYLQRAMR